MCATCTSNVEVIAAQVALAGAVLRPTIHRALAAAGLVDPPDAAARDARTVAFLRQLDLDPIAVLGAAAVARAEARVPQPRRQRAARWASARPIGSQSLIAAQ
jgi:hypothetical protein